MKKYTFFPLHEKSHWFLAVYENESSTFVVYDPYNEAQDSESKYEKEHKKIKQKCMESIKKAHMKTIKLNTRDFLIPLENLEKTQIVEKTNFVKKSSSSNS